MVLQWNEVYCKLKDSGFDVNVSRPQERIDSLRVCLNNVCN